MGNLTPKSIPKQEGGSTVQAWGLALSGGGLKGAAHLGALMTFKREGMEPSMIAGTSAGALVAALYAAGLSPVAVKKAFLSLKSTDCFDYNWEGLIRFLACLGTFRPGIKNLPPGIIKGDRIFALVRDLTANKKIGECSIPLAITAVDLDRGNLVVFSNIPLEMEDEDSEVITDITLAEAVRASISIPVIFRPAEIRGRRFLDGGVREILPLKLVKYMGAPVVIGVDLNDGLGRYHSPAGGLLDIFTRTLDIMMEETSLEEEMIADLIIRPNIGKVSLYEWGKIPDMIRAGERAALENLAVMRRLLEG